MNIFEIYLDKIKNLIIKLNKESLIEIPESLNEISICLDESSNNPTMPITGVGYTAPRFDSL